MKLRIYNPNHRETRCATCTNALVQRDSLGVLSRVYCSLLKQDISKAVNECSQFSSEENRTQLREFSNRAVEMEISPYDGEVTWTKDYKVIRKNGKWRQEMKKRRGVNPKRKAVSLVPPEPEKVN